MIGALDPAATDWLTAIGPLSGLAVLGLVVKGVFTLRRETDACRADKEFWRDLAMTRLESEATNVAAVLKMADNIEQIARAMKERAA